MNMKKYVFTIDDEIKYYTINKFIKFLKMNKKHRISIEFSNSTIAVLPSVATIFSGILNYYEEKYKLKYELKNPSNYLIKSRIVKPLKISETVFRKERFIFDKVFLFESVNDTYVISKKIIDYIKNNFICESGTIEGLSWCMNEVMDNVFNHSQVGKGYFMAQLHHQTKRISISIFDTGIGLMNSINSSNNHTVNNEEDAIRTVIMKGVTRDSNLGQGNGMWGLNQIIKNNHGYLAIMSGHTQINWDYKESNEKITINKNIPIIDDNVYGTRIDFSISFDNAFDIIKTLDDYEPESSFKLEIGEMLINEKWIKFAVTKECIDGVGTRKAGLSARNYLVNILMETTENIVIDFEKCDYISSSFADEFIAKLMVDYKSYFENKRIVISNCSDFNKNMIEKAIKEREKQVL